MLTPKTLFGVTRERHHEIADFINTALNSTETPEEMEAHIIAHFPAWTSEEIMVAGTYLGMRVVYKSLTILAALAAPECFSPKDGRFVDDLVDS